MITLVYLENALTPHLRKVIEAEVTTIAAAAPTTWVLPFVAFLDGKPILRADWGQEVPDGSSLAFIEVGAIPQGGGGGGSNPLRMILMIAVMVYAPYAATSMLGINGAAAIGAMGVSAVTAAVGMVGMALVNALVPIQAPSAQTMQNAAAPSPTYSLQAQGNSARLEAAIPEHFGRMICFPDIVAQPYTEYEDNEQYLYQLLCVGRGYYDLEDIKIEDSPLSSFDGVTTPEIIQPYGQVTLFPAAVTNVPEVSGQELLKDEYVGPFIINSVGTSINKIGLDFVATNGLFYANDDGSLSSKSVSLEITVEQLDDNDNVINTINLVPLDGWADWVKDSIISYPEGEYRPALPANTLYTEYRYNPTYTQSTLSNIYSSSDKAQIDKRIKVGRSAATNTPQRWTASFNLSLGRYRIKVTRTDVKDTSTRAGHTVVLAGVRGYYPDEVGKNYGDTTLIAIKIRATDNLSAQSSRKINVVATRKLPIWSGSSWSATTATRSPAWVLAYACKQVGLTDAQIDLTALLNLANTSAARNDYFDGRFDSFVSFWEAVTRICATVRTKPFIQGGILRVMRDQAITIPVAMFSTRNIVKNSLSIEYLMPTEDTSEIVDIKYFDSEKWLPATISAWVGAPLNKPTSISAKVDLFGITDKNQAYREGLYQAACNKYRRKLITFQTEMEGFIPSYGDLIVIQHDMPGWGQAGEVVSVSSDIFSTTLTLSEELVWGVGDHYIGLRASNGEVIGPYICSPGNAQNQVVIPLDNTFTVYTGDAKERTHYAFGYAETWRQPARVLAVRPSNGVTVTIDCVNEDSNVHSIDNGVITPTVNYSQLGKLVNAPTIGDIIVTRTLFDSSITISWATVAYANEYIIQQSNDNGETWFDLGSTYASYYVSNITYYDTTLIRVAAIGISRGTWSISNTMPPNATPAPTAPTATATGGEKLIFLAWIFGDSRPDIFGTEIWASNSNNRDDAILISTVAYPNQTYTHSNLAAGASGYYWIRVVDKYKSTSFWYPTSKTAGMFATASGYVIDLTPPPTPTYNAQEWGVSNGSAEPGISVISIWSDTPSYTEGHGHKLMRLYGAIYTTGTLPVFSDSNVVAEYTSSIDVFATEPATTWHLWLVWVSNDGVESLPAGGPNGVPVTTGQDVLKLLEVLSGEITNSELNSSLNSRINIIDGGIPQEPLAFPLTQIVGIQDSLNQQVRMDLDKASENLLDSLVTISNTLQTVHDAGIYVDPGSGTVKIAGLEAANDHLNTVDIRLNAAEGTIALKASTVYVDNAISQAVIDPSQIPVFGTLEARISTAEIDINSLESSVLLKAQNTDLSATNLRMTTAEADLDALEGQIALQVTSADFNLVTGGLNTRIGSAETTLTAIGDVSAISNMVTQSSRRDKVDAEDAETLLRAILNNEKTDTKLTEAVAVARTYLTARTEEGLLAEAQARLMLAAQVNNTAAALTVEQTARADADGALSQQITTLGGVVGDNQALLEQDYYTKVAADSAISSATTSLASTVAGNQALALQSYYTKAGADSAISTSISQVQARLDTGDYAAVKVESSANADAVEGLYAQYTVKIDVAGHVAGFGLANTSKYGLLDVDWAKAALGIVRASVGLPPDFDVFDASFSGRKLGDITNNGALDLSDYSSATSYAANTLAAGDAKTYIETVLGPRLTSDPVKYSNYLKPAASTSSFGVQASRFYVAPASYASATAPTAGLYKGFVWVDTSVTPNVTKYYTGTAWSNSPTSLPFVVLTEPIYDEGSNEVAPAGVYMDSAYIQNASITSAKIGSVRADSIQSGYLSAVTSHTGALYNGVNAYTLSTNAATQVVTATRTSQTPGTVGFGTGYYLANNTMFVGSPTNHMWWNGSSLTVRGTVYATAGQIGGITIAENAVRAGQTGYNAGQGFHLGSDGKFSLGNSAGNRLTWDGTDLNVVGGGTFSGDISAATGTFSGGLNVKSAASGARMEIKNNVIKVFDASGVLRVQLGDLSA